MCWELYWGNPLMRAPSYRKVRWKWRRKRRGVQLCLEEDNLRNTTGTMESIRSELLCQKDAFGRCFICPSLDSKLELAKATSWGRGIRSDFPFPTGIWSYRLTSKRSKTLLYFLISSFWSRFLSVQEGGALWAQQPLPSLIPHFRCHSWRTWLSSSALHLPKHPALNLF